MGNRKLRQRAAALLKERGITMRLFTGPRWPAYREWHAGSLRDLIERLELAPGTVVNDCDARNHRIASYNVEKVSIYGPPRNRRFFERVGVRPMVDQYTFEDGSWSCGCPYGPDPARTREEIEAYLLHSPEELEKAKKNGWWTERKQKVQDALEKGEHVVDEDGFVLEAFRWIPGSKRS